MAGAVRNLILKLTGYHPEQELTRRLQEAMENPSFMNEVAENSEGDLE